MNPSRIMPGRPVWLLCCVFALLFVGSPLRGQVTVRIEGSVVDSATGVPIAGAWLELASGNVRRLGVDSVGTFTIELPSGSQKMVVHALGYATSLVLATVLSDTSLVIQLRPSPVVLNAIEVQAERRLSLRARALPWSVRTLGRDEFMGSPAATPVDVLKSRLLQLLPCRDGECVRWRGNLIPPVVCIDERQADGGLAELRTYAMSSLQIVEVHDRGRMIRAYTTWFMEQVQNGRMWIRPALRSDIAQC